MANYKNIIPFIKKWEGGYVNDPDDAGGETNKGITYTTWCSVFGRDAHDKFVEMHDEDWEFIFKKLFWNKVLGDKINSQRTADIMVDWIWGSGVYYPELGVQQILNHLFGEHIAEDGVFGQKTIDSINSVNQDELYKTIVKKRFEYLDGCVKHRPSNIKYLRGWQNRLNSLLQFSIVH